jgi:dCTP deaminase
MHTRERIWTEKFVPIVDGKSSIGRLFIQIHATAGYGDPGYDGEYTLEVIVQHPVRVYAGMRIGQIRFHTLEGEVEKTYKVTGSYKDEAAQGAVASKAWRQFK